VELSGWYFLVKGLAYAAWMYVGLRVFGRGGGNKGSIAVVLGAVRLVMGLAFGFVIWVGSTLFLESIQNVLGGLPDWLANSATYAAVYVPVRWIEWGIFDLVLNREARTARGFFLGPSSRSRRWRAGGILISCLADIYVIASLGGMIPVGRFMC
jgi:hypothetical protein